MEHSARRIAFCTAALLAGLPSALAQPHRLAPQIGYAWPAGGRQGSQAEVVVGGQRLASAEEILVSGQGVQAELLDYIGPLPQRDVAKIREVFQEARQQIREQAGGRRPGEGAAVRERFEELARQYGITDRQLDGYRRFREQRADKKRQLNPQLVDMLKVRVTIAEDAEAGMRQLRVAGKTGLSNPVRFVVGQLPELCEQEPNDQRGAATAVESLPMVLNGQIMPGDVDCFSFRASQGQKIVVDVAARRLVPYLADAVPGWFQATVAVFDSDGRQIAFADDFRFDPDPALLCEAPADGEYVLEIRDAIYRGREDFTYRVAVGELPLVTGIFPLGGRAGRRTLVAVEGWNLTPDQRKLDLAPDGVGPRTISLDGGGWTSRTVAFAVNDLPESTEREPGNGEAPAESLTLPGIVNGRIDRPGDWDVFRINARKGQRIIAEVNARRLGSPLDSLLKLTDDRGTLVGINDDHEDIGQGLVTHHADSLLDVEAPHTGVYLLHIRDTQNHGGAEYAYRLRVSRPRPDFELRVVPSTVNARRGMTVPIQVFALRKDGLSGEIALRLVDAPKGFVLSGWLPDGSNCARLTLTVPGRAVDRLVPLNLEGEAVAAGEAICRRAVPADDVVQAFIYHHLVPAEQWLAAVSPTGGATLSWPEAEPLPVALKSGEATCLQVKTPRGRPPRDIHLALDDPPEGVTLEKTVPVPDGVELTLSADPDKVSSDLRGNLIVNAFWDRKPPPSKDRPNPRVRRVSLGSLPALPFELVARTDIP